MPAEMPEPKTSSLLKRVAERLGLTEYELKQIIIQEAEAWPKSGVITISVRVHYKGKESSNR
jgi:hypothetical protein